MKRFSSLRAYKTPPPPKAYSCHSGYLFGENPEERPHSIIGRAFWQVLLCARSVRKVSKTARISAPMMPRRRRATIVQKRRRYDGTEVQAYRERRPTEVVGLLRSRGQRWCQGVSAIKDDNIMTPAKDDNGKQWWGSSILTLSPVRKVRTGEGTGAHAR